MNVMNDDGVVRHSVVVDYMKWTHSLTPPECLRHHFCVSDAFKILLQMNESALKTNGKMSSELPQRVCRTSLVMYTSLLWLY